nr:MAG TPA: hypothetical protein [Caudoviricetes sp.]
MRRYLSTVEKRKSIIIKSGCGITRKMKSESKRKE